MTNNQKGKPRIFHSGGLYVTQYNFVQRNVRLIVFVNGTAMGSKYFQRDTLSSSFTLISETTIPFQHINVTRMITTWAFTSWTGQLIFVECTQSNTPMQVKRFGMEDTYWFVLLPRPGSLLTQLCWLLKRPDVRWIINSISTVTTPWIVDQSERAGWAILKSVGTRVEFLAF